MLNFIMRTLMNYGGTQIKGLWLLWGWEKGGSPKEQFSSKIELKLWLRQGVGIMEVTLTEVKHEQSTEKWKYEEIKRELMRKT